MTASSIKLAISSDGQCPLQLLQPGLAGPRGPAVSGASLINRVSVGRAAVVTRISRPTDRPTLIGIMWTTGVGLVVVLVALSSTDAFDREEAHDRVTGYRLRSQNLHVDHIEHELEKLEHEWDHMSPPIDQHEVVRTKSRLSALEGQ